MKNQIQLITYIDRIGCQNIADLYELLQNELKGLFGGVHLLPFYYPIDGEDAGFDPIDHTMVDSRLGNWENLRELAEDYDVMADLIVNHMSAKSNEFQDFLQKGAASQYRSLFLSFKDVFPNGATEEELLRIYRPRPGFPFAKMRFKDDSERLIWTTFTSNQVDIDVLASSGAHYLEGILDKFQTVGVKMIRLDAAGYAIKKAGTSCFMIPETFDFIDGLTQKAKERGITVLVEIHSFYKTQIEIAKKVDYVYDFALPVLVLDTLFNNDPTNLIKWLQVGPKNAITVLDTHDGIGIVDVASENGIPGLIADDVLDHIVDRMHANSSGTSLKATGAAASNLDLYQVNCTYFDALGQNERDYFLARAIQFFVPGIPQVYYVGLFAGENDMELLERTNVGRNINRHYFTKAEIKEALGKSIIQDLTKLMRLRNEHNAFNGTFQVLHTKKEGLRLQWRLHGEHITLDIDLTNREFGIVGSKGDATEHIYF
jgi:sucrose phosphorylase